MIGDDWWSDWDGEPGPDAGIPGTVTEIDLADIIRYEPSDPWADLYDPGLQEDYLWSDLYDAPITTYVTEDPIAAVRVAVADVLREGYEPTESSMQAAADIIAERQAGGTGDNAWARWLAQAGQVALSAVPAILNRVFQQDGRVQVQPRAQTAGMNLTPLLLLGGGALLVMSLLGGRRGAGSSSGKRRARRRR